MRTPVTTITILLSFSLLAALPAQAFWGDNAPSSAALDLQSGYDVNTVTTVSGQIVAIQPGTVRNNLQLTLESEGIRSIVCLGPQHYWQDKELPFTVGDTITVRGSKAQSDDGTIYLIAQKIMNSGKGITIILRDEAGRPAWAGKGGRRNQGRGAAPPVDPQSRPSSTSPQQ